MGTLPLPRPGAGDDRPSPRFCLENGGGKQRAMEFLVFGGKRLGEQHLLLQILAHAAQIEPGDFTGDERMPPRFNLGFEDIGEPACGAPALLDPIRHSNSRTHGLNANRFS